MRYLLLVLAAARVRLLIYCSCCCFRDDCSCFFRVWSHFVLVYDNSRASSYCYCNYLLSMQSPAPASSLAVPPQFSKPKTGTVDPSAGAAILENPGSAAGSCCCQCCCCCCCCFDDDCPCLFSFGNVSYRYERFLLLLRLQPARDLHHTVCLGTSR